jgi:hypothetical protein
MSLVSSLNLSTFDLSNTFSGYFRIPEESHIRLEVLSAVTEEYCIPEPDVVHCDGNVPTFRINLLLLSPDEGKFYLNLRQIPTILHDVMSLRTVFFKE